MSALWEASLGSIHKPEGTSWLHPWASLAEGSHNEQKLGWLDYSGLSDFPSQRERVPGREDLVTAFKTQRVWEISPGKS